MHTYSCEVLAHRQTCKKREWKTHYHVAIGQENQLEGPVRGRPDTKMSTYEETNKHKLEK